MPDLIYLLALLACPITMGVMMLVMMRSGGHRHQPDASADAGEVAQLRAEVEECAAQDPRPGGTDRPAGRPVDRSHPSSTL
jgi:uncharacterized protein YbaR (Trm112 family)